MIWLVWRWIGWLASAWYQYSGLKDLQELFGLHPSATHMCPPPMYVQFCSCNHNIIFNNFLHRLLQLGPYFPIIGCLTIFILGDRTSCTFLTNSSIHRHHRDCQYNIFLLFNNFIDLLYRWSHIFFHKIFLLHNFIYTKESPLCCRTTARLQCYLLTKNYPLSPPHPAPCLSPKLLLRPTWLCTLCWCGWGSPFPPAGGRLGSRPHVSHGFVWSEHRFEWIQTHSNAFKRNWLGSRENIGF